MGRLATLAVALLVVACTSPTAAPERERGTAARGAAHVGDGVVATVGGEPIGIDDVVRVVERYDLPPRLALERLVEQALLAREAQRQGLEEDPRVRRAARRAAVQALLARTVEGDAVAITPLSPEELARRYEEQRLRFSRPERRRSVQLVAPVPSDASPEQAAEARRAAEQAQREAEGGEQPAAYLRAQARRVPGSVELVSEELPPLARDGRGDPSFLAALFSTDGPGLVAGPVRTELGWHVVAVTEVEPAEHRTREEAYAVLQADHEARVRADAVRRLLADLAGRTPVGLQPEASRILAEMGPVE
ncbi:MAG: peptidyl-prolyl cis-trans isomerase [Sandaracinaceae bacterium]